MSRVKTYLDSSLFPEIGNGKSKYESPLNPILLELRRKHVVAAAAAATTGPNVTRNDSGDPWNSADIMRDHHRDHYRDRDELDIFALSESCQCHTTDTRRNSLFESVRKESIGGICSTCTKRLPFDPIGDMLAKNNPRLRKTPNVLGNREIGGLGPPQHAQALLHSTPHLRHLSQASMDMQGSGNLASSRGLFGLLIPSPNTNHNSSSNGAGNSTSVGANVDYRTSIARQRANEHSANELASFLGILAHEMSLDSYGTVENEVFTAVFALVHAGDNGRRMAGVAALDALIEAPSADEEKKAIKFANNLSSSLRAPFGDFEFLSAVSGALGHMAIRCNNVDFVESEVTRALEWLRTDRSDRRLAACLTLRELAIHASTAFYSKTSQASVGHGGSNEFLDNIFPVLSDPQPVVRACAADTLSECLKILVERHHASLTALLCQVHFSIMEGLQQDLSKKSSQSVIAKAEAMHHGCLLATASMLQYTRDFMLPRFDEICEAVLSFTLHPKALIRLEIIRLVPRLARRCPGVFGRRYLDQGLLFLLKSASGQIPRNGFDIRPSAYAAIGQLILGMSDTTTGKVIGGSPSHTVKILNRIDHEHPSGSSVMVEISKSGIIYENLGEIFDLVRKGLQKTRPNSSSRGGSDTRSPALHCAADLVEALGSLADDYLPDLINDMFGSGLSEDLIHCLRSIAASRPGQQGVIEERLLREISTSLAGTPNAEDICNALSSFRRKAHPVKDGRGKVRSGAPSPLSSARTNRPITIFINQRKDSTSERKNSISSAEAATESAAVIINMSDRPEAVGKLVLALRTLGSFAENNGRVRIAGYVFPILPFVRDVVALYLSHPSSEVRREASMTCCALMVPFEIPSGNPEIQETLNIDALHAARKNRMGLHSCRVVQEVLSKILKVAVSDPSPIVRLCVVHGLDERYDFFLCQSQHLQALFFLLQDEALATRAAGLQLLGRLTLLNPAPILPVMRRLLVDLLVELRCGGDTGRGREEAARLLVVYLRCESFKRLVLPVLDSLVSVLPLKGVAPRLASAAMEALGELARASQTSLKPWVKDVIPRIMETMQDQSSASKQRISLRTLGQISGSTGYVIKPYIDYPQLLSQATDVLPGTKRAPWALRREVIRTLGFLGALDPDQYHTFVPKTRKGGAVGGGYFLERVSDETGGKDGTGQNNGMETGEVLSRTAGALTDTDVSEPIMISQIPRKSSLTSLNEKDDFVREPDDDMPAHLYMYEQYAMVAQPVSHILPAQRITPTDEDFYPTVAIQALTRIFKDASLAVHHGMVMQAIMFIFNFLGQKCVPFLSKVVPHMLYMIRNCSASNLREALLKQVASLSTFVKEHLRPYVAEIFEIVDDFWNSRHLGTILALVSKIAAGIPDDFRKFLPRLVRKLLLSLEEVQTTEWFLPQGRGDTQSQAPFEVEKLELILRSVKSLRGVLGEYLHILVPALMKLADSLLPTPESEAQGQSLHENMAVVTLQTLAHLLENERANSTVRSISLPRIQVQPESLPLGSSLCSRAAQPLIRLLLRETTSSRVVGFAIIEVICVCALQLGRRRWINLYDEVVRKSICEWHERYGMEGDNSSISNDTFGIGGAKKQLSGLQLYDSIIMELEVAGSQSLAPTLGQGARKDSFMEARHRNNESMQNIVEHGALGALVDNSLEQSQSDFQVNPSIQPVMNPTSRHRVNQGNLQRAWDVSQRASREDWDEWMRRFGIQLLREAPSPALRATASLAQSYQPLSRELFSAAFVCCWEELNEQYRRNLVQALETAFVADVSPEILQTLLNLAEFMEHDGVGNGLPIDISNLAELALKCRAYAKALHYKEREYNKGGSGAGHCVEALISINKKLDLPEAALGVLKTARVNVDSFELGGNQEVPVSDHLSTLRSNHGEEMLYSVVSSTEGRITNPANGLGLPEVQESWLAKLGSWSEALVIYEERLRHNPNDFDAILGCMRCLDASGEWQRVLDLAQQSWPALSQAVNVQQENQQQPLDAVYVTPRGQRKALKFCAQAAWRLGQWEELEKYASELVHGNFGVHAAAPTPQVNSKGAGTRDGGMSAIDFDGSFYTSVLHVHRKQWSLAADTIDAARRAMDSRFTALMAESYKRAYPSMVTAQTLAEMEEIISFRKLEGRAIAGAHRHPVNRPNVEEARDRLLSVWRDRLAGCRVDAEVHSSIVAVRSLVLGPTDEVQATLTLSDLSRQAHRNKLAERVLLDPLAELGAKLNGPVFGFGLPPSLGLGLRSFDGGNSSAFLIDKLITGSASDFSPNYTAMHEQCSRQLVQEAGGLERLRIQHQLYFAYLKHLWALGQSDEAMHRLESLSNVVDMTTSCEKVPDKSLAVTCWLELSDFKLDGTLAPTATIPEPLQIDVLFALKRATSTPGCGYRAWHAWALLNFRIAEQLNDGDEGASRSQRSGSSPSLRNHVIAAVNGFVNAISLGTKRWSASVQQDLLNLLTCLFKHGEVSDVAKTINEGMGTITLEAWLGVLPQLLARIHIRKPSIRSVLHPLLTRLGASHPQALMYPLSVLLKSPVAERKSAAESLMTTLKSHSSALVEEALMVSSELIRVAILWLETWHEGLEDASRLYFGEGNVSGMLDLLLPLHEKLENGAETQKEAEFIKSFGSDLAEAHSYVKEYIRLVTNGGGGIPTQGAMEGGGNQYGASGLARQSEEAETAMNKAWDIYYTVFRWINKQLPALTKLELSQCSPALSKAHNLELGVPGSYRVDGSYVKIEQFIPSVQVITSKQRPRKITLRGSDGKDYVFLLKGHEDLRQDERVMQLFGLVNALLERDRQTKKHDLNIQRYAICPLSHNCGVVGWVPHCDTLHSLIKDYRQSKRIPLNMENREMLKITADYDILTVMQKVEVFTDALRRTTGNGNDLYEILWLKSTNSEEWLERRTRYTRSLAVMSMVGYILGLGDRHPSNLMLDALSGRVLHIDFGDCFEVAMNREKYPEKIPFRLTRMLVKAMEVSGIEGSYRSTCERTMSVLRDSRDSLVAMLEAFVYDPLISWRLAGLSDGEVSGAQRSPGTSPIGPSGHPSTIDRLSDPEQETGVPIDVSKSVLHESIAEGIDEDGDDGDEAGRKGDRRRLRSGIGSLSERIQEGSTNAEATSINKDSARSAAKARSLQMYSSIQTLAANLSTSSRIASITGEETERVAVEGSIAKSRIARSLRQREVMSLLEGEEGAAHEEALNEKALKVIRRVQDKLSGTDFPDMDESSEPLDVPDQVQRLVVQATSSENLCQLFIGWCAFW